MPRANGNGERCDEEEWEPKRERMETMVCKRGQKLKDDEICSRASEDECE